MSLLFTRSQVLRTVRRNLGGFVWIVSLCFKHFHASSSRKFGREQTFFSLSIQISAIARSETLATYRLRYEYGLNLVKLNKRIFLKAFFLWVSKEVEISLASQKTPLFYTLLSDKYQLHVRCMAMDGIRPNIATTQEIIIGQRGSLRLLAVIS